jgi:pimeloyl-ACP methyl ester carboxylesterase
MAGAMQDCGPDPAPRKAHCMIEATVDTASPPSGEKRMRPPRLLLTLAEGRGLMEFAAGMAMRPMMMMAPRGDGHPVLVLPGFMASDRSTGFLRKYLADLGHDARAWGNGRNLGRFYQMRDVLSRQLLDLQGETGRKVSLVGWSLGGVFARYLALTHPDAVRSVVTLGSPFAGDINATNAKRLYEYMSGEGEPDPNDISRLAGDLPVANSSIYTKLDGVVNWRTCIPKPAANSEAIEVHLASHLGIGGNPAALWAVADRLAQPEGQFTPFSRKGPFAFAYA